MIEPYDDAVDLALEREENVEAYLRFKTVVQDEFQALLASYWYALQAREALERLKAYREL